MVTTRRSNNASVEPDDNRIIAIVTGANSGFGVGICQALLSNLSLPPGTPMPATIPSVTALAPSQGSLLDIPPKPTKAVSISSPPALTLILACRTKKNAEGAKQILLSYHHKELNKRKGQGLEVREGWLEGLQIVCENVDLASPGGDDGILSFCERIKSTYPHVTTIYLNAAVTTASSINFPGFFYQSVTEGLVQTVTDPKFGPEESGVTTADGRLGLVWAVNVLSAYIMVKELESMLRRSPQSLPLSPRAIYTSSFLATASRLHPDPLNDYQLIEYDEKYNDSTYKASKYMGDLVMLQLDKQYGTAQDAGERELRVLPCDPGYFSSNIYNGAFTRFVVIQKTFKFFYWLTFYLVRWLGSPHHVVYATYGALSMLYAALIPSEYLMPSSKVPGQKFAVVVNRRGTPRIKYGEVDRWEETLATGEGLVRACESLRLEYRREENLE